MPVRDKLHVVPPQCRHSATTGIPVRRKYHAAKRLAEFGTRVQFPPPPSVVSQVVFSQLLMFAMDVGVFPAASIRNRGEQRLRNNGNHTRTGPRLDVTRMPKVEDRLP